MVEAPEEAPMVSEVQDAANQVAIAVLEAASEVPEAVAVDRRGCSAWSHQVASVRPVVEDR